MASTSRKVRVGPRKKQDRPRATTFEGEETCVRCGALLNSIVVSTRRMHAKLCEACTKLELDAAATEPDESQKISPAVRELAQRALARKYLLPFILRFDKQYMAGWFHRDLCQRLERFVRMVEEKKSPRLMIQVPPRHGKSRLASVEFPAWVLGQHPDWEFIAASYAVSLPIEFSRKIRERFRDEAFQAIFTAAQLSLDSQSAETWRTTRGGGFLAAGTSGGITGKGAHILLVDDPLSNAEEADSERTRNSIWDWFTTTAYTRLAPGGGALVIQTRWHTDDLSGRLEAQMRDEGGEQWEIVRYPAIATEDEKYRREGESLHPERYDLEALLRIQKAVGPRAWNALYQQNPVPSDSTYFTKSMLQYYDSAPDLLEVHNSWDLAVGQKQQNDWSVGVRWGLDPEDNLYVLNLVRGRFNSLELVEQILDLWQQWPNTQSCGIEEGQIKMTLGPMLEKRMTERRLFGFYHVPLKPGRQDKVARARTLQGRMQQGKVFFPREAEWMPKLIEELVTFPFGRHDDQADALSYAAISASELNPPSIQLPSSPIKAQSWKSQLHKFLPTGRGVKSWLSA